MVIFKQDEVDLLFRNFANQITITNSEDRDDALTSLKMSLVSVSENKSETRVMCCVSMLKFGLLSEDLKTSAQYVVLKSFLERKLGTAVNQITKGEKPFSNMFKKMYFITGCSSFDEWFSQEY